MAQAELNEAGDGIILYASQVETYLAETIPGSGWRDHLNAWHVPLSWPGCLVLRSQFGYQLQLGPRLQGWAWEERLRLQARMAYQAATETTDFNWAEAHKHVSDSLTLYPFQTAGVLWLAAARASLLADDMGSGKTVQAAVAARLGGSWLDSGTGLVICPAPGRHMWRREIEKWAPDIQAVVIDGSAAARRKQIEEAAPGQVMIISWAALAVHTRLGKYSAIRAQRCPACGGPRDPATGDAMVTDAKCETHRRELNHLNLGLVIADEAHRAKSPYAKQTRAWWQVSWDAGMSFALTGTPLESSIADLWSILHGLDPVSFPGKSKFLDLFATTSRNFWGGTEILGLKPENRELFYSILNLYMRRLPKELVLPQLPPKMPPVYRYPTMGAEQARAYKQMTADMIAQLNSILVAKNPLAKLSHQIGLASATGNVRNVVCRECKGTGGFYQMGEHYVCHICEGTCVQQELHLTEPSCKVDDLVEFLKDHPGKPLVVFAVRRELVELAHKRLVKEKITCMLYTGSQDQLQKDTAWSAFQQGSIQVILCTFGAGSELVTFTASDTIYFMQRHTSHTKNKQAEDRIHRIGSEGHDAINYVISCTEGTIESRIAQLYDEKGERFEEVVRDRATLEWLVTGK